MKPMSSGRRVDFARSAKGRDFGCEDATPCLPFVIAGLDPAIQSFGRHCLDRRVTPGDDKERRLLLVQRQPQNER
jgi:hypothetical protein